MGKCTEVLQYWMEIHIIIYDIYSYHVILTINQKQKPIYNKYLFLKYNPKYKKIKHNINNFKNHLYLRKIRLL